MHGTNLTPGDGYTFTGMEKFCGVVEIALKEITEEGITLSVQKRSRILATSLPAKKLKSLAYLNSPKLKVWCCEMMEPTISVLPLLSSDDNDDDDQSSSNTNNNSNTKKQRIA